MKKILLLIALLPFISCSIESSYTADPDITGEWVLVKTWGQFPGSEQTGPEMPFQERYYFGENRSFLKLRLQDGEQMESGGTYTVVNTGDESRSYFFLVHESPNVLSANCSQDLTEEVYITSDGKMKSNYEQCDGTGVLYEKLN